MDKRVAILQLSYLRATVSSVRNLVVSVENSVSGHQDPLPGTPIAKARDLLANVSTALDEAVKEIAASESSDVS